MICMYIVFTYVLSLSPYMTSYEINNHGNLSNTFKNTEIKQNEKNIYVHSRIIGITIIFAYLADKSEEYLAGLCFSSDCKISP